MPYKTGIDFVQKQSEWVKTHRPAASSNILEPGMQIGKAHRLIFLESSSSKQVSTRLIGDEARVTHPVGLIYKDEVVQAAATRIAIKALKAQAGQLLPDRLARLASQHGFVYKSVSIKRLSTRWGSCSSHAEIVLNCHLMQLSWDLIDYVLLHELLHTKIMRHGSQFWAELDGYVPNLQEKRAMMKQYSPSVIHTTSHQ